MTRLCVVVALGCVLGFVTSAGAAEKRAESRAREAVAPLVVENAICIGETRRRVVCLLRHPNTGALQCRSTVLVRGRRVRVIQSHVCFENREVTP